MVGPGAGGALRGKRVLVVQGRHMLATDFVGRLRAGGGVVVGPVTSVQDALELIAATLALDAALLDASLGDGWADPISAALARCGVPLVVVSGQDA